MFGSESFPVKRSAVASAGLMAMVSLRPYLALRYDIIGVRNFVTRQISEFKPDVFWGFQISSYPFLRSSPEIYRVMDLVDSPSRHAAIALTDQHSSLKTKAMHFLDWRIGKYEKSALENCEKMLVSSVGDLEYLQKRYGATCEISILPNCVPDHLLEFKWQQRATGSPTLLFVGNLDYQPNREAVKRFLSSVFPLLEERCQGARIRVVGAGGTKIANLFNHAGNVTFAGYVENLIDEYLAADVLIAPLSVVTGSQYKILEAMAVGLPVIASRVAGNAIGADAGRQLLTADSAAEYETACSSLFADPGLTARISQSARQFIQKNYLWNGQIQIINEILSDSVT
ncbi:MAG: glycosyltransferase family 4 protein [Actinobacteria bacterium]|nr:glycosyltransferase family 4 protein [Actinomycetota bacterium]